MIRAIDPSRRTLPISKWPAKDRSAWIHAIQDGDLLEGRGPAAHWAERTKETNIQHYGRWLGWLAWQGRLDPAADPADRITRETVSAYVDHLRRIVAPKTRLSMLVGLKVVVKAMAPDRSWRWLQDACNRLQRIATPSRDKRLRVRSSRDIYTAALDQLERTVTDTPDLEQAIAYRDALMLALLAARPVRVKNMTSIEIGRHLVRQGNTWHLQFEAGEVKNRVPLDFTVPASLAAHVDHYLDRVRPAFPQAASSRLLWLNRYGTRLGRQFVYWRITKLTRRLFDQAINPHLLRDCAATTLAVEAPEIVAVARPLLGHTHAETTERYYIQASQLMASRRINALLDALKAQAKDR